MGEGQIWVIWDNGIETHILPYVKWIASPGLIPGTEYSVLVHWDDPEGWDGERDGRGSGCGTHVYPWLIHINA